MTIVFPELRCKMVLVVASIGSEGLLGRRHCNRACLINSTSVWANCGLMDSRRYNYISSDRWFGRLPTSRAPLLCPWIVRWLHSCQSVPRREFHWLCSMIEPDLDLMESYGVLVGRT